MMNRRTLNFSILATALFALCLPVVAVAQNRYPDRGRNRDYGRHNERQLRDTINRLDRLSKDFEKNLDRALDRSRVNGTRREDRINAEAKEFRRAVGNLKSRVGNGRDLSRSSNEAHRVLQQAQQVDRIVRPRWFDSRLSSQWAQIRQELRAISDIYGSSGYYGNRPGNDPWYRRVPLPF